MTKTEKLEHLFTEWEKHNPKYKGPYVKDGIINQEEWDKTTPKILFVTKEPNHRNNPQATDLRQEWNDGEHNYMFAWRIAEWTFGIYHSFKRPFSELYGEKDSYLKYLQKTAVLNIKKDAGGSTVTASTITTTFENDKDFICKQIDIISPDIIINCQSFNDHITDNLYESDSFWIKTEYGTYIKNWKGRKVIDFYHPSSRTPPPASYALLKDIFLSKPFQSL